MRGSLPPSIVLEVLQILEGEINLRNETRVAEQAKAAIAAKERLAQTSGLTSNQDSLQVRTVKVTDRIRALPNAGEFGEEIGLLTSVAKVMTEAVAILGKPDTGKRAIGVETEAIELLLQSRRMNPNSGGGSGSTPGGGGGGTTSTSAIALLGRGSNEKELRVDRGVAQATGESGAKLPEEFRGGLDEYFNRLEKGASN
jgi:hypothetical protein